jgi:hypothetical protein
MIDLLEKIFVGSFRGWFVLITTGIIIYLCVIFIQEKKERKKTVKKKRVSTEEPGRLKNLDTD